MIAVAGLLFLGLVVVGVVLLLALRRWTLNETHADSLLRSPDAHAVAYLVPGGQDPVGLMASLSRSGFVSMVDNAGGTERLIVACDAQERAKVRTLIEHVDRGRLESPEMHLEHVRFEDEAETDPT
jgi:hypothetical protein